MNEQQLFLTVKDCLANKTPLSVIAGGDGEMAIIEGFEDVDMIEMIFKRQFGFTPSITETKEIMNHLLEAYKNTDIIALKLNPRDGLNHYWYNCVERLQSKGVEVKQTVDMDYRYNWLHEDKYKELLTGLEDLCYISCRDLSDRFKEVYGIKNVHSYIIAPEAKFTNGYDGMKHYPDQFKDIERWMNKMPISGTLCLTGTGIMKSYCNWFRDKGGVALDVGSVFDQWAGRATRGPNRGLNAIDETYKL